MEEQARTQALDTSGSPAGWQNLATKNIRCRVLRRDLLYHFEQNNSVNHIFEGSINPERIIEQLSVFHGKRIQPEKTLIIFDEVQEVPRALTSLKYFTEEAPEYAICCAGSLLGVALHQGTSFPVGKVEFLTLQPLSFR